MNQEAMNLLREIHDKTVGTGGGGGGCMGRVTGMCNPAAMSNMCSTTDGSNNNNVNDTYLHWGARNYCCGMTPVPFKLHIRRLDCCDCCFNCSCCKCNCCKCKFSTIGCQCPCACIPEKFRCCHITCGCFPVPCFPLFKGLCCAAWEEVLPTTENVADPLPEPKYSEVNIGLEMPNPMGDMARDEGKTAAAPAMTAAPVVVEAEPKA